MKRYEMVDELIMTIGHLTNEMEHIGQSYHNKETTIRLKQLRVFRAETANKLFNLVGIPLKLSHKRLNELKDHWCMIKHYATGMIHMLELVEQYSTYNMKIDAAQVQQMIKAHKEGFWKYFNAVCDIVKKGKSKKCNGCKKDIEVRKTDYYVDDIS